MLLLEIGNKIADAVYNLFGGNAKLIKAREEMESMREKINKWESANLHAVINEELLSAKKINLLKLRKKIFDQEDADTVKLEKEYGEEEAKYLSDKKIFKEQHVSGIEYAQKEANLEKLECQKKAFRITFFAWTGLFLACYLFSLIISVFIFLLPENWNPGRFYILISHLLFFVICVTVVRRAYSVVENKQEWIMEWFGSYLITWDPGLHFFFPFFMSRKGRVFVATQSISLRMDSVARDGKMSAQVDFKNSSAEVIVELFIRIFDAKSAMYEIDNVINAVREKMEAGIRAYYGAMNIDDAIANRADVDLRSIITQNATEAGFFKEWGVEIVSIAVTDIKLPEEVSNERIKKLKAEKELEVAEINNKKADVDASIEEKKGAADGKRLQKLSETISRPIGDILDYDIKKRKFTAYEKAGILIASDSPSDTNALTGAVAGAAANAGLNAKQK